MKKSALRYLYRDLVSDSSAAANLREHEIDERVAAVFELEEPSLVYDMREHFGGRGSQFDIFWEKAKEYLEEDVGTAGDIQLLLMWPRLYQCVIFVRIFRNDAHLELQYLVTNGYIFSLLPYVQIHTLH